jgi:hypothetical protein
VIIPIANQQPIDCKGHIIQPQEIASYRVVETEERASNILAKEKKKQGYLKKAGNFLAERSPSLHSNEWMVINAGKNVTNDLKNKFTRGNADTKFIDFATLYKEAINKMIEKITIDVYDTVASFDHSNKFDMLTKLAKLNGYIEILSIILPNDFKKKWNI